jgi:hypothetical protein
MTAKKSKQTTSTAPQIEQWPTAKPIPYARNARKIDARAVSAVAGSIKEFGFKSPILVDTEGVIIAGHTRLQAAQSLGLETVPVIVCRDLTPDQVKAYRLADNRVAEFSEWDSELLKLELGDIELEMDFAGFDELMAEFSEGEEQGGADAENPYTQKVETPEYKATGECPPLADLCDASEGNRLALEASNIDAPEEVKQFLAAASCRFYRFNYKAIAEYYCHAPAQVQRIMERMALVIVDFKQAIELGFVKLNDEAAKQYEDEHGE